MPLIQKRKKLNDFVVANTHTPRVHKPQVNDLVRTTLVWTGGNLGNYMTGTGDRDSIYVYHMEKVRPKFTQKKITKGANKGKTKSTKVRAGGWTARVFKFPRDLVKSVTQHERHFDIVLK